MSKEKGSNFYIGVTLWLTAIFAIPLLVSVIFGFILHPYLQIDALEYTILVISLIALVPGTIYSCKYVKSRYIIQSQKKVILYATSAAIFAFLLFTIFQFIYIMKEYEISFGEIVSTSEFLVSFLGYVAKVSVFTIVANSKLKKD